MYEMCARIIPIIYQKLFIKIKVDWKNSRGSWGVLGLTSKVCLKASKVYPAIHNRIPAEALVGAGSYWRHCLGCQIENPKETNRALKLQTSRIIQFEKTYLNQLEVVRRFHSLAEGQSELQYSKSKLTFSILPLLHYTNQMFRHSGALCMMVLAQQYSLSLSCYSHCYFYFTHTVTATSLLFLFVFAFRIILSDRSVTAGCVRSDKSFKMCNHHSIQGT